MPSDDWKKANDRVEYGPRENPAFRVKAVVAEGVFCPRCMGEMVHRRNGKTGDPFLGCRAFPQCNGTRPADSKPVRGHGQEPKKGRKRKRRRNRDAGLDAQARAHMDALGAANALGGDCPAGGAVV